jgi:hypothetical protein
VSVEDMSMMSIPLVTSISALSISVGAWALLGRAYGKMLVEAKVPWFLRAPIGELLLLSLFRLGTISRRFFPDLVGRGMQVKATDKANVLLKNPPKSNGICFIGSSTFTYWRNLVSDFKELGDDVSVFNSAFGGSCTHDIIPNVRKLCTMYKPLIVVYFCGTNNLAQGLSPESVLEGFELFSKELFQSCPQTHIIYMSVTKTPFYRKWNVNNCMETATRADEIVKNFCNKIENKDRHSFVNTSSETSPGFKDLQDTANFLGDNHHLNDNGHKKLADNVLLPVIKDVLQKQRKNSQRN